MDCMHNDAIIYHKAPANTHAIETSFPSSPMHESPINIGSFLSMKKLLRVEAGLQ